MTLFWRIKVSFVSFYAERLWTSAGGEPLPVLLLIAATGGNITTATTGELSVGCCGEHAWFHQRPKQQDGGCVPPSLWLRTNIKEKQEPVYWWITWFKAIRSKRRPVCGCCLHKGRKPRERLGCQSPDVFLMLFSSFLRNAEEARVRDISRDVSQVRKWGPWRIESAAAPFFDGKSSINNNTVKNLMQKFRTAETSEKMQSNTWRFHANPRV